MRKRLNYGELLREIRTGNVKQLKFFQTFDDAIELEGPCLVVFKDDTLAQGFVPHFDYRIPYAMENHGVAAVRLPSEPTPGTFSVQKMWTKNQQTIVLRVIPVIAIGIVYYATQLAAKWKVSCCLLHWTAAFCQTNMTPLLPIKGNTHGIKLPSACMMSHNLIDNMCPNIFTVLMSTELFMKRQTWIAMTHDRSMHAQLAYTVIPPHHLSFHSE